VSAFIDGERERFGVEPICRTLDVSASAYYQRATGERSDRRVEDERLLERIRELHAANYYAYGYRKMWLALRRAGEHVGRDRVKRLMRQAGMQGAKRRGKPWRTTTPDPSATRPADLVERDFSAQAPNRLWLADFTYLRCWEGVVFFSFVIDAYSRRIVGWQFASHMRTDLVLDALRMALTRRDAGADVGLIHHSDAGSQYTSQDFQQVLDDHRVLASIGSVGDAYDNAMAERFVDTFKTELISDRVWRTRSPLEPAIVEWVAWLTPSACRSPSATFPGRVRGSIRTAASGLHILTIRKPTNPVSAKPSPPHHDLAVDQPVWLTPDDVAQGKDTVVNAALNGINGQTP
jgi:putative transposase